jgi:hypothetical protein
LKSNLRAAAQAQELDVAAIERQTNGSDLMEGLYIKVEENGQVSQRCKFVRRDFLTTILDSQTHWLDRPILPNQLQKGMTLFDGLV